MKQDMSAYEQEHLIRGIEPDSLAEAIGIRPGMFLRYLDGRPVPDVFDYRLRELAPSLLLTLKDADGGLHEIDIEKDEGESLGLIFENEMMTTCTHCHNRCVFCFIDQLPKGLRASLYFKDDDLRFSFLTGNYVTLTNLTDSELDRLIRYRFSPVNVSVHTTNPALRRQMMGNPHAGELLPRLQKLAGHGLALNLQIVLCPGLNDGEELERTLDDLSCLGEDVQSIAIVPVGITRYRLENQLLPLRPVTAAEAQAVIRLVDDWQQRLLSERGRRTVFAADEFYLLADLPLPRAEAYEGFPQLENGVGMAALFIDEMTAFLAAATAEPATQSDPDAGTQPAQPAAGCGLKPHVACFTPGAAACDGLSRIEHLHLVTGVLAAPLLESFLPQWQQRSRLGLTVQAVENVFFGELITVAGLLTGSDLAGQVDALLTGLPAATAIVLPDVLLRAGETVLLDDWTVQQLADYWQRRVLVVEANATGLWTLLRQAGDTMPEPHQDQRVTGEDDGGRNL